ncbi:MAG: hypothetical protein GQ574_01805 [Crocinitomix sp.]|nr:hypothetical protein [Crocinitomix sp.]
MRSLHLVYFTAVVFILIGFGQNAFAQDGNSKELKLYSNFAWQSSERTVGYDTTFNQPITENYLETSLGYFSPAFSWATAKGNRHEIELSRLQINQIDESTFVDYTDGQNPVFLSGDIKTAILIALRYEYNFRFFKKKEDMKFKPSLGLAIRPYYSKSIFQPHLSTQFPSNQSDIGALVSIIPRITYDLNERWFIDLNMPVNLAEFKLHSNTYFNPALPKNQQTVTTLEFETLPSQYLIRLGVGFRL